MAEDALDAPRESLTHLLRLDHHRLDAVLAAAKQALRAGDLARARARFSEFREGLERHIAAEEEVLFPAFEALTGAAGGGPTHVMRSEHGELRRLMAEVASGLEGGGGEGHTTPLAALTARIYAHNGKEERILYPALDRAAGEAGALQALVDRLGRRGILAA
jgi:iron-sulfur cluster repair protein YtfE (RIC family)